MIRINKKVIIFFTLIFAFSFISCPTRKEETIVLDNSEPLALAPGVSWALVIIPYASYKADISWDSITNGHCRKGDILQVMASSIDADQKKWYKFEAGWLSEDSIDIYTNKYKAENAASKLKD
ncbi:MAG: hypothetical protein K5829_04445 [Treponema sp.]|nr:hypothetical protein [Treponema sp.]